MQRILSTLQKKTVSKTCRDLCCLSHFNQYLAYKKATYIQRSKTSAQENGSIF